MTHHTVNECADYADWLVVLDDGTGFLMLESNQITLIGIAPESRGKGYVKVLVNEAQRIRGGREIIIHAINDEVSRKVYEPIGFRKTGDLWLMLPRIPEVDTRPPMECWA
jgi:ribosomal protein S18 acetylase RimI-like enzyme